MLKIILARAASPLTAAAILLPLAACEARAPAPVPPAAESAAAVQVSDDLGRTVRLAAPARRIVSLLPATTETLVALGAGDRLVARTDYDEDPALADLPSVGGGLTPSLEAIAALRPDLVVAWEESGANRVRPRLEELGIPVFAAQTRDTAGIYANIARLGTLTGLDAAADSLARWIRDELDAVRASVEGQDRPTVVYIAGLDPPIVAGGDLFIGEILSVAGGDNLFAELSASPQVSMEEVLRRRPEVVLIPGSGEGGIDTARLAGAPGWAELIAGGRTRIASVPADVLHRPGPSVVRGARILRDAIHPGRAAGGNAVGGAGAP